MSNLQKIKKHRESKEIKIKHETYANGIKYLFRHPSSMFYVLVCKENYLKIFDLPTMSMVAQTHLRMHKSVSIRKCIFTKNCNIFYTFTNTWSLMAHKIEKVGSAILVE